MELQRLPYVGIHPDDYASIRGVLDDAFDGDDGDGDGDDDTVGLDDFSDFEHWFVMRQQDVGIVAVTGLLTRDIHVGESQIRVAGIGGVATAASHRRRGCAHRLINAVTAFVRTEIDVEFLVLQCQPELIAFYAAMGWRAVDQSLFCTQSDGELHRSPELPMVFALGHPPWPDGSINMNGLPW